MPPILHTSSEVLAGKAVAGAALEIEVFGQGDDWIVLRTLRELVGGRIMSIRLPNRRPAEFFAFGCGASEKAMLEVESGRPLDDVLARFTRIPPSIYHALGADELSIEHVAVIDGGRS